MKKQVVYVEPADYIPKDLRKKYKLGEYAEKNVEVEMKVTIEKKDGALKADGVEDVKKLLETLDKQWEVEMLGAIIGDVVGSRFEFNNIKTKKFQLQSYLSS